MWPLNTFLRFILNLLNGENVTILFIYWHASHFRLEEGRIAGMLFYPNGYPPIKGISNLLSMKTDIYKILQTIRYDTYYLNLLYIKRI